MDKYIEHKVKTKTEKIFKKAFKILFMIIAAILFLLLFGYCFMLLWNWLMPDVFGLPILSYWKAVGILVMAKILFGNLEGKGHKSKSKKSLKHDKKNHFKGCRSDFSKWEFYDAYWKEEGENAFNNYVERNQQEKQ
ncbi:hypothetical protein JQC67_04745 [Aurantibacter crassamenti]|uniref:hypothetical protein n=1 Tax=Aurantibacter crassamenti TaxID=1837375 RepID=UPI00193ACF6C|nr:hypothetical protein [Aurantibacter crassamenti]MBM1105445.1 hypothetical protein [Aurantibacter crassamenti]